jgi:hypothetical protein
MLKFQCLLRGKSDVYHLLPMSHVHIEVRIKLSASKNLLTFFILPLFYKHNQKDLFGLHTYIPYIIWRLCGAVHN